MDLECRRSSSTKLRKRDNWWQKHWRVVATGVHGSRKKVSTIECKLCLQQGKHYKILSVRSRNIKHLEREHGLTDKCSTSKGLKPSKGHKSPSGRVVSADDSSKQDTSAKQPLDYSHQGQSCHSDNSASYSPSEFSEIEEDDDDDDDDGDDDDNAEDENEDDDCEDDEVTSVPASPISLSVSPAKADQGDPPDADGSAKEAPGPQGPEEKMAEEQPEEPGPSGANSSEAFANNGASGHFSPVSPSSSGYSSSGYPPSPPLAAMAASSLAFVSYQPGPNFAMPFFDQERVEYMFAAWCLRCNLSPSVFDVQAFRDAIHQLNPAFRIPSHEEITFKMYQVASNASVIEAAKQLCSLRRN